MMRRPHISALVLLMILVIVWQQALGQNGKPAPSSHSASPLTLLSLQSKIDAVSQRSDLSDFLREQIQKAYQQAKTYLESEAAYDAAIESYSAAINTGPQEIDRAGKKLKKLKKAGTTDRAASIGPDMSPEKAEQELTLLRNELVSLKEKAARLEDTIQREKLRPIQITEELSAAQKDLKDFEDKEKSAESKGVSSIFDDAQLTMFRAGQQAMAKEIVALTQEQLSHDTRLELLSLTFETLKYSVDQSQAKVRLLEEILSRQRQADVRLIEEESVQAEREASGKAPAVQKIAEENTSLGKELADIVSRIESTLAALLETEESTARIEQDYERAMDKVTVAVQSRTIGQILLQERYRLPDPSRIMRGNRQRQKELADIWLRQFRLDEQLAALEDMDSAVLEAMNISSDSEVPPDIDEALRRDIQNLLMNQRQLIEKLRDTYTRYLRSLGNLEIASTQLGATITQFSRFLDERVLWVPSTSLMGAEAVMENLQIMGRLLTSYRWTTIGTSLFSDSRANPHIAFLAVLAIAGLMWRRRRYVDMLDDLAVKMDKPHAFRFSYTVKAMLMTVVLALPVPLLFFYCGWRLSAMPDATIFKQAVGESLSNVAMPYLYFQSFFVLCCKNGVASSHLQWHEQTLKTLRRNLPWFMLIFLSGIAMLSFLWNIDPSYRGRIGVPVYISAMVALSVLVSRIISAGKGGDHALSREKGKTWQLLFRRFWRPFLIALPLLLAFFAALGYFYSAVQVARHLHLTAWLIVGAYVIHDLVIRRLVVDRYRLAVKLAQEKRSAKAAASSGEVSGDVIPEKLDMHKIDLQTISQQTRQLLNFFIVLSAAVGIWFIWREILPAFRVLEEVAIWKSTVMIDGQAVQEEVTLAHIALAVVIAAVTVLFVRNIPSFLEIALLQRLPVTSGTRYAITNISQYVIISAGIVSIFKAMGGSWSSIQWLVAALGVGLGFGLQEIFGNFMSGLIILFERPIRVGDTVTVGDINGTVSRIRIRATTITDWDNKELIVPNKTFITEQLINWTLSDPITRIKIPVGVAYGSDTALTHRVILDVVRSNPLILEKPEPMVYFKGFGDSSLDFIIHAYIRDISHRLIAVHEIHMAVEQVLREHGITIPFPQRDVHIYPSDDQATPPAVPGDESDT